MIRRAVGAFVVGAAAAAGVVMALAVAAELLYRPPTLDPSVLLGPSTGRESDER